MTAYFSGAHRSRFASPTGISRFLSGISVQRKRLTFRIQGHLFTRPRVLLWLFAVLRRVRHIFILRNVVIVTRHDHVLSVLERARDFELGEYARDRMLTGQFILDIDWPRAHADQEAVLHDALCRDDAAKLAAIAAQACRDRLSEKDCRIDVPALARDASDAVIEQYCGVTTGGGNRGDLRNWLTVLASAIILLPPEGTPERDQADHSADLLFAHVRALIAAREKSPAACQGDVLSRLLAHRRSTGAPAWLTEDWAARMICGLAVFGMATVVRTATDTIDELLSRGEPTLSGAKKAAAQARANPAILRGYIYEALRFRPMLPVLFRYCPRATIIGEAHEKRRIVPRGSAIVAPPLAAMHDPKAFPDPGRFDPTRPTEKSLVFGAGQHVCTGRKIAELALVEIVGSLLREPNLRREKGRRGRITYCRAAAHRLILLRGG